jgi:hypothetical protein
MMPMAPNWIGRLVSRASWPDHAAKCRSAVLPAIGVLVFFGCAQSQASPKPPTRSAAGAGQNEEGITHETVIRIPSAVREEHREIHAALTSATDEPGALGEAARELARLLEPHFAREEEIALPPLGLLRPLANGEFVPSMSDVLPMTDALKRELPQMLREHAEIAAAAQRLERIAGEERNLEVQELARKLQLHAKSEEEVFYPAAILVGDLVRVRLGVLPRADGRRPSPREHCRRRSRFPLPARAVGAGVRAKSDCAPCRREDDLRGGQHIQ